MGLTGFIVRTSRRRWPRWKAMELDRAKVRAQFDQRFTARRMAEDYVDVYEALVRPAWRLHAVNG